MQQGGGGKGGKLFISKFETTAGIMEVLMPLLIRQVLGADGLLYQSVEDLIEIGHEQNPDIEEFEASCFTGGICVPPRMPLLYQ